VRLSIPVQYFTSDEIGCPCGCGVVNLHSMTVKRLDLLRDMLGYPLRVNSACRCPEHNKEVGGSLTSSHIATKLISSRAIDIHCKNDLNRAEIIAAAIRVGFPRIGVYSSFVHLDDDPNKPAAVWYGK